LRNRGYSTYFPLKVGHPLSFAWAPIRPCIRAVSSLPAPPILGLGANSGGGQVVVAGVQKGGHPDAAGRLPVAHSAFKSPSTGLVGGGRWALVGPLTSDMSEAAPSPLRAAFIVSRLNLMVSPALLASLLASVAMLAAWPTIRLLLRAIISFFAVPSFLARSRNLSSPGSWIS
jgi:hypothetical protein